MANAVSVANTSNRDYERMCNCSRIINLLLMGCRKLNADRTPGMTRSIESTETAASSRVSTQQ